MKIEFTAAEQFLDAVAGQASLEAALRHTAYQTVFEHGHRFGNPCTPADIELALEGWPSPFYGLLGLAENLPRIRALLQTLYSNRDDWLAQASDELLRLLPDAPLDDITIYPIIGYDMGIGLSGSVCMNLNTYQYLDEPFEFLYFMIHEAAHVLYERSHHVAVLAEVITPRDWLDYFALWVQNEGFAVYAPYRLRRANRHLADRDYQVLEDPDRLAASLNCFTSIYEQLDAAEPLAMDDYLEAVFGSQRVTYRSGCHIFRCLEQRDGLAAIPGAFHLPPDEFIAQFSKPHTNKTLYKSS